MSRPISFLDLLRSVAPLRTRFLKIIDYLLGGLIVYLLPSLPGKELSGKIQKILFIRPGGIGDAVFLLPILKVLKNEDFIIDVLCEKRNVEVFAAQHHLLNNIYLYERQLPQVFKQSYDAVIDTEQWHYLSAIVCYFVKTQYRVGFATRSMRAKLFNVKVQYLEHGYELDNFKRLFEKFLPVQTSVNNINDCFGIPAEIKVWAQGEVLSRSVSVFLGSSISIRRLSVVQLLKILRDLLVQDYCPILLGGRDAIKLSRRIMRDIKDQRVLDFVGKVSLIQSAALIQCTEKFIGPDSGLMHLACSVGTPVIAIFGPGDVHKWYPKGNHHRILSENVSCSPCTQFGYTNPSCGGSYHCMKEIKLENI